MPEQGERIHSALRHTRIRSHIIHRLLILRSGIHIVGRVLALRHPAGPLHLQARDPTAIAEQPRAQHRHSGRGDWPEQGQYWRVFG